MSSFVLNSRIYALLDKTICAPWDDKKITAAHMRNALSDDLVFLNVHMKQQLYIILCNIRISNVKTPRPHTQSGVCERASARRAERHLICFTHSSKIYWVAKCDDDAPAAAHFYYQPRSLREPHTCDLCEPVNLSSRRRLSVCAGVSGSLDHQVT
jgi:hypothetical protein